MAIIRSLQGRNLTRCVRLMALAALLAIAFTAGSVFNVHGTPASAVYSACVSASTSRLPSSLSGILSNRSLYNVTVNGTPHCQQGDATITWNQQGPIGETGANGPTGPTGPAGTTHDCNPAHVYPGVNLAHCNLAGADLSNADLTGANLTWANLADTNLTNALLFNADLTLTALVRANIPDSNLLLFAHWNTTLCPDNTSSDNDGGTCLGHLTP